MLWNQIPRSPKQGWMSRTFFSCAIVMFSFSLTGCSMFHSYPPLDTVQKVDLSLYAGKWYEIARYPHSFEKGCTNVSALYTVRSDGWIDVLNSCTLEDDGRIKQARGRAKVVDQQTSAKLKVTFFWPFYGDYWILDLDPGYQYAIVGEPSRKYLWILSRSQFMESDLKDDLYNKIKTFGYSLEPIIETRHTGAR